MVAVSGIIAAQTLRIDMSVAALIRLTLSAALQLTAMAMCLLRLTDEISS